MHLKHSLLASAVWAASLPLLAADYVIDRDTTETNGGTANVVDGNDSILITSAGAIATTGDSDDGINAGGDSNTITQAGTITTTGGLANGIRAYGSDNTITHTGAITTSNGFAEGINAIGNDNTIKQSGTITTSRENSSGIVASGNRNIIIQRGTITTDGSLSSGVYALGDGNTITDSGTVTTTGPTASGVVARGDSNTITQTGQVTTGGDNANGISSRGDINTITLSGTVQTSGRNADAIYVSGNNNTVAQGATLTTNGALADGIYARGDNNMVTQLGTISTNGRWADGISVFGDNNAINATGSIVANGADSAAVYFDGQNNLLELSAARARIVGPIWSVTVSSNPASNSIARFQVGPAQSYQYKFESLTAANRFTFSDDTESRWRITDLDNRPMIEVAANGDPSTVLAVAAGIGHVDIADELQQLRLSQVDSALRWSASVAADGQRQAWVAPHYVQAERGRTAERFAFETDGFGITVGVPVELSGYDTDVVFAAQSLDTQIEGDVQSIDSTSVSLGLAAPTLHTFESGLQVSGKALLGYNQYDMTRQVLTNFSTTTGVYEQTGDYSSVEAILGLAGKLSRDIDPNTQWTADLGLDLAHEAIASFQEIESLRWADRDLTQAVVTASIGIEHSPKAGLALFTEADIQSRSVLSGEQAKYRLSGSEVSYKDPNTDAVSTQLSVGARFQPRETVDAEIAASAARSDSGLDAQSLQAKVHWRF